MNTTYNCQICGKSFEFENDCIRCEKGHLTAKIYVDFETMLMLVDNYFKGGMGENYRVFKPTSDLSFVDFAIEKICEAQKNELKLKNRG